MAQSVEHLTLDFSSGHDPRVMGLSPKTGSVLSVEPAWDSLSFLLFPSPSQIKKQNKQTKTQNTHTYKMDYVAPEAILTLNLYSSVIFL